MNMAGNVLATEKISVSSDGLTRIEIPLPDLVPGIYYAVLLEGNKVLAMRGFALTQK